MLQILFNLLSLKALSTPIEVYLGLVVVWVMLLVAGVGSVLSHRWSAWKKIAWCLLLVAVPVVGMTFYCFLSLCWADYSFLKLLGLGRQGSGQLSAKPIASSGKRQS